MQRSYHRPKGSSSHLDLAVEDLDAGVTRCVEFGALLAEPQPGQTWRVLLDRGHPFCLTLAANWG